MIRLSFVVWLLLIASAGAGLYFLKYRVIALEGALEAVNDDIAANREAMAQLHAEWSYLNDPQAIAAYADFHLDLRPTTARDVVAFSDIPLVRGRAPSSAPAQAVPNGSVPPPPLPPMRAPAPGMEPPDTATDLVADADEAPAPELALVPAAPAISDAAMSAAPADPIGQLIADVLEQRADAAPLAGAGNTPETITRGLGQ